MFGLFNKFRREEGGIAVTELAVVTPIFLLMFLSTIELGHMIYYSITVEKALRSAVTYAGRNEAFTTTVIDNTKNIVKTGEPSGTGPYLVRGWEDPDASVQFSTHQYTQDLGGNKTFSETVISVTADVPYVPVVDVLIPALEYLMKTQFRSGKLFITLTHEQAMIGN